VPSLTHLPILLALAALAPGCARSGSAAPTPTPPRVLLELPPDWKQAGWGRFEQLLDTWPPGAQVGASARASLEAGLAGSPVVALRAVLFLARVPDAWSGEALLGRLERRVRAEARPLDGPDVTAAAALAGRGLDLGWPSRLVALADGDEPHPDLDVRTECAASALHAGEPAVIPFLLRVLRAATPAERDDPPDWAPQRTLAWSKSRASRALALYAGTEDRFRPDGSFEHQMSEADRLSELTAAR